MSFTDPAKACLIANRSHLARTPVNNTCTPGHGSPYCSAYIWPFMSS